MPAYQIGIDLGTTILRVSREPQGILRSEPTVVAWNKKKDKMVAFGSKALKMLGKNPPYLEIRRPMEGGVISDYRTIEQLMKLLLTDACRSMLFKPEVALCIPSTVTAVERRAAEKAAMKAGARRIYLIEEPVAAALGMGLDISKPVGNLLVDIGGGTTDASVLSMNAVVTKNSCKVAGNALNMAIQRHLRNRRELFVGEPTAEQVKKEIGCAVDPNPEQKLEVKGHHLVSGLPGSVVVTQWEIWKAMEEELEEIAACIHGTLEKVPPELAGDLVKNGVFLTGGGALLRGMDQFLNCRLGIPVQIPDDPQNCVARGTGRSFRMAGELMEGFSSLRG